MHRNGGSLRGPIGVKYHVARHAEGSLESASQTLAVLGILRNGSTKSPYEVTVHA
jgi:hypothetical protein